MALEKINLSKYTAEIKRNMHLDISEEIIVKDLLLTLVLAEFEKHGSIFKQLIFKGGTLLARNYLSYHRFSEDLDFVYQESDKLRELTRKQRERKIKAFVDEFVPKLKEVADALKLEFSTDRSNTKYCTILSGRTVYILRLYYNKNNYVKIEVNFIEKMLSAPKETSIKTITDYFDSKELMFIIGLKTDNFRVLSYIPEEIILEKYRALLTRDAMMERDLFDLFLLPNALKVEGDNVIEKIKCASLIKKEQSMTISKNLKLLENDEFFSSSENIKDLAIARYDLKKFEAFKDNIKPILIRICKLFLKIEQ